MTHKNNTRKGFTLVEMLGVLAIIAILISVIAVGVMSAINRARIVATVSNFKNLETAVVGFVALPNSGGTVPLTEGNGTPIQLWSGGATGNLSSNAAGTNYTLDQVLRASGLIERTQSWRVGADGMSQVVLANEPTFILSKNAFAAAAETVNGVSTVAGSNNWAQYNRSECVLVTDAPATPAVPTAITNIVTGNAGAIETVNFYLDGKTPLRASRCALVVLRNVSLKDAQKLSAEVNGAMDDSEFQPEKQLRGRLVYEATTGENIVDVYYYLASF